jgi:hypothetical protein
MRPITYAGEARVLMFCFGLVVGFVAGVGFSIFCIRFR